MFKSGNYFSKKKRAINGRSDMTMSSYTVIKI